MRHLFYALGGGLGHYQRALRVIRQLPITGKVILVVSPHIISRCDDIEIRTLPESCIKSRGQTKEWIYSILRSESIDQLWLDAFPFGLFGEFQKGFPDLPVHHISRILQSAGWMHKDYPIHFEKTLLVEPVSDEHIQFLQRHSKQVSELTLEIDYPEPKNIESGNYTLLTHSGPQDEVDQLIDRIENNSIVLAATAEDIDLPDHYQRIPSPLPWYRNAETIISGCGFNTMLETAPFRGKHIYLPFPRRFDDQFLRAERATSTNESRPAVRLSGSETRNTNRQLPRSN